MSGLMQKDAHHTAPQPCANPIASPPISNWAGALPTLHPVIF
jgi:hypothetical protein